MVCGEFVLLMGEVGEGGEWGLFGGKEEEALEKEEGEVED